MDNQPISRNVRGRRLRLTLIAIFAVVLAGAGIFVGLSSRTVALVSDQTAVAAPTGSTPSARPTDQEASRSLDRGGCPVQVVCDAPDLSASPTPAPTTPSPAKRSDGRQYPSCSQIANSIWDGPCPPAPSQAQVREFMHEALAARGWDNQAQFACLDHIIEKESSWHVYDENSIHAYGLPQAMPGNKMATAGADWGYNPRTQLKWMMSYIAGRYHTPCGAWAARQSQYDRAGNHWY